MRLVVGLAMAGCVSSTSVVCEDGRVCPQGSICDDVHALCVTSAQLADCATLDDRAPCTLPTEPGNCQDHVCLPIRCGNSRVDIGEMCDDGNTVGLDGCSADCTSDEKCGNGVIDLATGEVCDDSNSISHDGCSSRCALETARWKPLGLTEGRVHGGAAYDSSRHQILAFGGRSGTSLSYVMSTWSDGQLTTRDDALAPPREYPGVAYDLDHQRLIVFGGLVDTSQHDTWAFDGTTWTRLANGPARTAPCFVYDAAIKKVVMFGGYDQESGTPQQGDTYVLDGTTWTLLATAHAPTARYASACAYDPDRGKVVLFGGHDDYFGPEATSDTWEFDGSDWTQVTTTGVVMPALEAAAMAYDHANHTMIMIGGSDGSESISQQKMYVLANGTAWSSPANPVPKRFGAVLTEDGAGGLVLFGGQDGANALTDVWRWDGAAWKPQTPPTPRVQAAVAYDPDHRQVIVTGGIISGGAMATDTWVLSAAGWTATTTGTLESTMVMYDRERMTFVRFGGFPTTTSVSNTTAVWNGTAWTALAPTAAPPGRASGGFVFDAKRKVGILFGGYTGPTLFADTWAWDGTVWTQLHPAHSPPARSDAAMTYDWRDDKVVLFGGTAGSTKLADTWLWDGTDWTEVVLDDDHHPSARSDAWAAWNAARGKLELGGGNQAELSTWEWDGPNLTWQQLLAASPPHARLQGNAYPLLNGTGIAVVLGSSDGALTASTFALELANDVTDDDKCDLAIDSDGDGLAGCADPDCWTECAPRCPPYSSCM